MPWANNHFGIKDNPITVTPYFQNNDEGSEFQDNLFLLLNGFPFMLLNGAELALL